MNSEKTYQEITLIAYGQYEGVRQDDEIMINPKSSQIYEKTFDTDIRGVVVGATTGNTICYVIIHLCSRQSKTGI